MIGNSEQLGKIHEQIRKVAPTQARVLITGENGVGKELVARKIHLHSRRSNYPLIAVNCAAIPFELIESELFGHEQGAFTSAVKRHIGKFELANKGTIFLDEIGDMHRDAQAKILRVLQEGKITRIGSNKEIAIDIRIIAATNKNLKKEIVAGNFREDLYYRLNAFHIHVPSLNERPEDIPLLVNYFLETISNDYNQKRKNIEFSALKTLTEYSWTGNIRELRNAVERLIILSDEMITQKDVMTYL